jgi:UDP:flavonoid glycosyltransferase YjiC (YdhE family)
MMGAAFAAAERLGLPTAVLVHVLYRPFVHQWGQFVLDPGPGRAALGTAPPPSSSPAELMAGVDLVLALTPPGFDFDGPDVPANTHYAGPVLFSGPLLSRPDRGADAAAGVPRLLVSFSTTLQGQREALPPVLEAIGRLPVRATLTLGGVLQPDEVSAPNNVEVLPYVSHRSVLPGAAAVVCHGGLSTVMAALSHGVPLLCLPQGREQPLNAERVEAVGAGVNLAPDATPDEIAAAITALIDRPSYRASATAQGRLIADCDDLATRLVAALPG